jgi:hypothetical protein
MAPSLHLDQFKRDFSPIRHPGPEPMGDIDRLVFVDFVDLVADRHFRNAANDDPMLSAMTMPLQ